MKRKTKEYPSKGKYLRSHPTVSFRLTEEDRKLLYSIVRTTNKSISDWVKDFIHHEMAPYKIAADQEEIISCLSELNAELTDEAKFYIPCSICGKPIKFSSTNANWELKVQPRLKTAFSGWYHTHCKPDDHATVKDTPPREK